MMVNLQKNNEPLDLSYLRDMSGDSAEFIIEMIDMFKIQTPLYISDLEKAIVDKDWPRVSNCAHKIKPTFAYVGREDARDYMQMMENNARDLKNVAELPVAFEEISSFVEYLYEQLDKAKTELEKQL